MPNHSITALKNLTILKVKKCVLVFRIPATARLVFTTVEHFFKNHDMGFGLKSLFIKHDRFCLLYASLKYVCRVYGSNNF